MEELEVKVMSLKFACQIVSPTSKGAFLSVNACLNVFRVMFGRFFVWSFSMRLALGFLVVVSPDCGHYSLGNVDGVESDE